ncbi:hypothetical protein PAXRUDRAFT_262107 [Paxillus rubicundulus Ve08.2h10]|uniref:Uncharacterized protein n=1 Tax=Paxillus rubicundulus Ve08.2h10 TaxID=930991 RepID=A0A0D0DFF2_9AGAM|nr:hypothetical protein PAXRUDRAFT_262107 [Paxillus rubicundulus Ve08.2h10]
MDGLAGDNMLGDDDSYWDEIDEIDLEGFISGLTADKGLSSSAQDRHCRWHVAIIMIISKIHVPRMPVP